jgi:hypothetical protein
LWGGPPGVGLVGARIVLWLEQKDQRGRVRDSIVVAEHREDLPAHDLFGRRAEFVCGHLAYPAAEKLHRVDLALGNERALNVGLRAAKDHECVVASDVSPRFGRPAPKAGAIAPNDLRGQSSIYRGHESRGKAIARTLFALNDPR